MTELRSDPAWAMTRIEAIEDIRQLRARFARALDTKNWAELRECMTEDCYFDCTQEEGITEPWIGAGTVVDNISQAFAAAVTVHHAHTAEIEIKDADNATGIWAMQDLLRFAGETIVDLAGYGHYHENYRRTAGRWQIARYKLTRLRVDVIQTPRGT